MKKPHRSTSSATAVIDYCKACAIYCVVVDYGPNN